MKEKNNINFMKIKKSLNYKHIFIGIKNWLFGNQAIEEMAEKRMKICNTCEHFDTTGNKCYVPGTQPCCAVCGCKLNWMIRVPEEKCSALEPKWGAEETK